MKSAPIKSSTQEHLEISDIRDDVVILKDNSATIIIQTAAINFELLSVDEQDSIIYSYAGLLNSLNFTIQIVVRSKKIDLSNYLQLITQAETHQANPDIKRQIFQYRQFIQTVVQQNNVLEKKFYVVIPFPISFFFVVESRINWVLGKGCQSKWRNKMQRSRRHYNLYLCACFYE